MRSFFRASGLSPIVPALALIGACVGTGGSRGQFAPSDAGGGSGGSTDAGAAGGAGRPDVNPDVPPGPASTGPADVTATVNPGATHQTLVGFGGAVAFDVNFLSAQSGAIYDALFPQLGLDILRIGNWYQNQQATGSTTATTFSDSDGVTVVQKATAALGHAPILLMSSWSPPSYLKSNATTKGSRGSLAKDATGLYQYAAFASWWTGALEAYAARGLKPDYISIQNEPDYYNAGWETCLLGAAEGTTNAGYGSALDAVFQAVQADAALATKPQFVGPEVTGIRGSNIANYAGGMNLDEIGAFAHHLYQGGEATDDPSPPSFDTAMGTVASVAATAGKPIFMTEYSPNTPTLLNTAWLMYEALTVEGVSAYVYWDLVWGTQSPVTAMVTIQDAAPGSAFTLNDPYYAVRHFARWTDPGWTRVDATASADAVKAIAFTSPDGGKLTVVLINTDAADHTAAIDPGGFAFATTDAYRSSGTDERTTRLVLGDDRAVTLPAGAIATVTFGQ
jgi:glucuronoarabinoxylan endo-1,4-beta-xylanase